MFNHLTLNSSNYLQSNKLCHTLLSVIYINETVLGGEKENSRKTN